MNDQTHTDGNEPRENANRAEYEDVSRRGMIGRVGTVGALTAAGGVPLLIGSAQAQTSGPTEQTWSDDFEDGNIDGWQGETASLSNVSYAAQYSIEVVDGHTSDGLTEWIEGPTLDISEEFSVSGRAKTTRSNAPDASDGGRPRRFGLFTGFAQGVLLVFNEGYGSNGVTFLATDALADDPTSDNIDTIDTDFPDTWVDFRIETPQGENYIRAKVWEAGTAEPSDWQLEREIPDTVASLFSIEPGTADDDRIINIDQIEATGYEAVSENLRLDAPTWLEYGQTAGYTVSYTNPDTGQTDNVTSDATVESSDTNIVSVDQSANTITATTDRDVSGRVELTAEYSEADAPAYQSVTVADISMENIDILPPWRRIQATYGDSNIQSIIVAILAGIGASHLATSFAGLGLATITTVVLWFGGYLETGFVMVAVFLAMFIGFNMAANIDYTMR